MEYCSWVYAMVITYMVVLWLLITSKQTHKNMPPSPLPLPIIGHLYLLNKNKPFHRALHALSIKYGPICFIKLGRVPIIVVSSPALAEECFTTNDIVLANRPRNLNGLILHNDYTTFAAAPYGPLWREHRRITATEFFSATRLSLLTHVREEESKSLIKGLLLFINKDDDDDVKFIQVVEMRPKLFECSFNIIMRMMTGKRYVFEGTDKVLYEMIKGFFELSGASNPIDFFPFLRWFNYGNIERKMLDVKQKMDVFLDGVLEECRKLKRDGIAFKEGDKIPMIYKLFDLQHKEPKEYSDQTIKGIIMVLLVAGIDTSVLTMEWSLALLLNNKNILEKARLEVDKTVGKDRLVNESDLDKLSFIQNIINEAMRLYPAGPLLIPHVSSEDCKIAGYNIPKGIMVLISAWAVHRDPNVWDDPLTFKPERFEGDKVNENRTSFIPFGLGRRSCPGASLSSKVTTLILSSLVQCFDWDTVDGLNVDLTEGSGLTMPMATPLIARCKARPSMIDVISSL